MGHTVLQQIHKYINLVLSYVLGYFPRVSSKIDATRVFCVIDWLMTVMEADNNNKYDINTQIQELLTDYYEAHTNHNFNTSTWTDLVLVLRSSSGLRIKIL